MMLHRHFEQLVQEEKPNTELVKEGHDIPVNAEAEQVEEKPKRTRRRKVEE